MRTFETLGAGKKLVTTNASVRGHDFFDERNILVIDRLAPRIPSEFFEVPPVELGPAIRTRYSIAGWLDELLSDVSCGADVTGIGHKA